MSLDELGVHNLLGYSENRCIVLLSVVIFWLRLGKITSKAKSQNVGLAWPGFGVKTVEPITQSITIDYINTTRQVPVEPITTSSQYTRTLYYT